MSHNYLKFGAVALGIAVGAAAAGAAETYRDVTGQYLKDAAYIPGWQGVIGKTADGVGEVWNGAFRLYRVVPDAPAGSYTLTCNAFYRCGTNDYSRDHMSGNDELHKAYVFLGDATKKVMGLFDEAGDAPNGTGDANAAFEAGKYVNEVTVEHKGGDLVLGICNPGCYNDEWTCFDNFKLVGPEGEVALENGDFSEGIDCKKSWNFKNADNSEKLPDIQKADYGGVAGGTFRKTGASPYKFGQQVELPAGTYRFGILTFHRYGSTMSPDGKYFQHKNGSETAGFGKLNRTPKDWFEANDYDAQTDYAHAYIFVSKNENCPNSLDWDEDFGDLTFGVDQRVRVKDCWEICNGNFEEMPDNNTYGAGAVVENYETPNKCMDWKDSGNEREAAAAFVANPEKWYQYVEFTLTEPGKVWVGMGKNMNTADGYWHPWADITLKALTETGGVEGVVADEEAADAPAEYYNLQGIRVANPANGLYIKVQGKKAEKVAIR